jgi:putative addiction module component (TIGR02574 family)
MSTVLKIPPEFEAASKSERIAYVEALWDRIAQDQDAVAIPESHKQIVDERLDAYRANPQAGRPWDEVRDNLLDKLRRS